MVDHIKRQLAAHGIKPSKAPNPSPKPRTAASTPKEPTHPREARQREPKEPAEKQGTLPPLPDNPGPHQVGNWTIRNTRAYAPDARVVLMGPEEEFEQLLAHLKAFKP